MSIEKDFVPYKEALELKELGFDEECFSFYDYDGELYKSEGYYRRGYNVHEHNEVIAPTFSQAFRWFREKYKLHSSIDFQKLKESDDDDIALYEWKINEQWQIGKDWYDFKYGFKHHSVSYNHISYEEAELECLRKLIEIVKNK